MSAFGARDSTPVPGKGLNQSKQTNNIKEDIRMNDTFTTADDRTMSIGDTVYVLGTSKNVAETTIVDIVDGMALTSLDSNLRDSAAVFYNPDELAFIAELREQSDARLREGVKDIDLCIAGMERDIASLRSRRDLHMKALNN